MDLKKSLNKQVSPKALNIMTEKIKCEKQSLKKMPLKAASK